jgi:hypothetical protein
MTAGTTTEGSTASRSGSLIVEPAQQRGGVRRDAGRGRKHGRIVGGPLVDDGQPRRKRRAVFGIDGAVDGGGEDDAPARLQPDEGVPPGRIVGCEAGAGDRHEPAAGGQTRQRRGDMAVSGVGHAALDIGHDREGRVHQHDAGRDGGIEMIVDLRRVETGDGNGREEKRQQAGAGVGQLVEDERAAGDLGEDGEQAGAGRRLQHPVGRSDGRGVGGDQAERDRRRELLEGLAFRRTPRMRRQQVGDF